MSPAEINVFNMSLTEVNEFNIDQHPILEALIALRQKNCFNFAPEFSGQRFCDYDRGLMVMVMAAYNTIRKGLLDGSI